MKKSILLVNVSISEISTTNFFVMPVGLLSIAAFLIEHSFPVDILDFNVVKRNYNIKNDDDLLEYFSEYLKVKNPALVGFSTMIAGQFKLSNAASIVAKKTLPDVVTVMGGAHVTEFPTEILKHCQTIDYVVLGEGERQALKLANLALKNYNIGSENNGIAYRIDGKIKINSDIRYIRNLNGIPMPAYDLVNFNDYLHDSSTWHNPYQTEMGVRVPLITSRGCPNLCTFCSVGKSMGLGYRSVNSVQVVNLIQKLYEEKSCRTFVIYDANFAQSNKRVIEICNEICKRNLKINLDLPTGLPLNASSIEIIDSLADAGLIRTCVSIESGDCYIRNDVMKKNIKEEEAFITIERIRKYPQIFLMTDFVMGIPEETVDSMEASVNFIKQLDSDDIDLSICTPYPGTALFEQCVREDLFFSHINKETLYSSPSYTHSNRKTFIIKPYKMDYESLCFYRDKILLLRKQKIRSYHKRMKEVFNVESMYRKELLSLAAEEVI